MELPILPSGGCEGACCVTDRGLPPWSMTELYRLSEILPAGIAHADAALFDMSLSSGPAVCIRLTEDFKCWYQMNGYPKPKECVEFPFGCPACLEAIAGQP